ncbi:hypothetical protein WUBG_09189 [Wuchereria bancrofti]|uniref:Uncharacterized protein n=1 Tax=Wuchereria bancrofti TaxID=6293 RepID=J9ECJ4_WUCBA|nr:hypothetical protein WUBG_09189 [Wuchereria bancrofti]
MVSAEEIDSRTAKDVSDLTVNKISDLKATKEQNDKDIILLASNWADITTIQYYLIHANNLGSVVTVVEISISS